MRRALAISVIVNILLICAIVWSLCTSHNLRYELSKARGELARGQELIDRIKDIDARERQIIDREAELTRLDGEYIARARGLDKREAILNSRERNAHSRIGSLIDESLAILESSRDTSDGP